MTSRRDWRLQQLGITQWVLRRPAALLGDIAITLPAHTRLIMVADTPPALTEPLVRDILHALNLRPDEVMQLTPERVAMLHDGSQCNSWCLGVTEPLALPGAKLISPGLEGLRHSSAARASLWQQICENEHDFFPSAD